MIPLSLPYFPFMIPLYSLSIASGWWYTYPSEKYIRSSVGMMTFPTEWKVIKFHGSKPPISIVSLNMVYIYIHPKMCPFHENRVMTSPRSNFHRPRHRRREEVEAP